MKSIIFSFFYLFFGFNAFSQYQSGYLLNYNSDTTTGFIRIQSGKINCRQVFFKTNMQDEGTLYMPGEVKGYSISNGDSYQTESITYREKTLTANNLLEESKRNAEESEPVMVNDTAFLCILITGKASLFSYYDDNANEYFFIRKEGDNIYELYQLMKFGRWREGSFIKGGYRLEKNYLGILRFLFNDCQGLMPKIDKTDFTESALIKITRLYNDCEAGK